MCFVNEWIRSSLKLKFEVMSEHLNSIPSVLSRASAKKGPFETEGPFESF